MEQQSSPLPRSSTRKRRKSSRFRKLSILSVKSLLSNDRPQTNRSPKPNVFQNFLSICPCVKKPKNQENGRILMVGNGGEMQSEHYFKNLVDIGK